MTHPTSGLDDAVHQRVRLGILAIVNEVTEAEFGFIRESLGVTAGNLSRHLDALEQAGLATVRKGHVGRRPRTWIAVTPKGRDAFHREVAALRALIAAVDAPAVVRGRAPGRSNGQAAAGAPVRRPPAGLPGGS